MKLGPTSTQIEKDIGKHNSYDVTAGHTKTNSLIFQTFHYQRLILVPTRSKMFISFSLYHPEQ